MDALHGCDLNDSWIELIFRDITIAPTDGWPIKSPKINRLFNYKATLNQKKQRKIIYTKRIYKSIYPKPGKSMTKQFNEAGYGYFLWGIISSIVGVVFLWLGIQALFFGVVGFLFLASGVYSIKVKAPRYKIEVPEPSVATGNVNPGQRTSGSPVPPGSAPPCNSCEEPLVIDAGSRRWFCRNPRCSQYNRKI
jgi:hypothetical protein